MTDNDKHSLMANALRVLAMDAVEAANSGHPGLPLGAADIATVLFTRFLKFDPASPHWPDRDRFVLSAGHGSMLLYAALYLLGYEDFPIEQLKRFRQFGANTAGHPEYGHGAGIETTTGPLGQGLANAVGMAIAERIMNARFGAAIVDHHTYALVGDGDLMEGIAQEAISLAGHLKLSRLIVLFDDNGISIDGPTTLTDSTDILKRFTASGWETVRIDGHDQSAIAAALETAQTATRPTLIACRTVIGYGSPHKAGSAEAHGAPLGKKEVAATRRTLGWENDEPFEIPSETRDAWRIASLRSAHRHKDWEKRYKAMAALERSEFDRRSRGDLPANFATAMSRIRAHLTNEMPTIATRKASEVVLETINKVLEETVGGSADLTDSNSTRTEGMAAIAPGSFAGRFIHYGVREHAMAAIMNGMALYGGIIPYSGTFLVFSDYCRPAMRMSALMGLRVVYVMTHDSIGLGEDGPTHQPVEHLAALRAIPNLNVFRPADPVETAECWQLALESATTPSVLALTRQAVPPLRTLYEEENLCRRGAYEIGPSDVEPAVSIFATGSEVQLALEAKRLLDQADCPTRVVSVPCFGLLQRQSEDYRAQIRGTAPVRIAVEAAIRQGWDAIIGSDGHFVGMTGFGQSAPMKALFKHFGITAERVADTALAAVAKLS